MVIINHTYILYKVYISNKGFASPTFNWADVVKKIKIILKSAHFENAYLSTLFVKRWTKSLFSYKYLADKHLVCQQSIFKWFFNFCP